ncbi:F-type H+-transporting ATPase subunit delta [Rhizomicrobium palustre]|uniref:ATP synthase subunit delta n=1 Tax=Rhizomicrobium palustre TaxID=189966 RepID=A0A846N4S6_9PROT|nr:F-type H+-transporting ATPase subunit delta [Rhizomicrobium palustre]
MADEAHLSGIAGRYALAVFELAQEERKVEVLSRDLQALKQLLAESADLRRLVRAPVFSRDDQARGMQAVLAAAGADALTARFVQLLCSKRRLFVLPDVIRDVETLVAKQKGEIEAEVTSAHPLTDAQTVELKAALKDKLGREPLIATKVDPTLLGGLVVKVGSRMIDASLRAKLNGLRTALRGAAH